MARKEQICGCQCGAPLSKDHEPVTTEEGVVLVNRACYNAAYGIEEKSPEIPALQPAVESAGSGGWDFL